MTTENQMYQQIRDRLLPECFNAAVKAGAAIMKIYKNQDDYDISLKSDKTPITVADRVAHNTIKEHLGPTRIPVLSEEGREMLYDERRNWELFLLVDPLDGTLEFIKGNNEFTVNIALMADNECVASALYVPYPCKMYIAAKGIGAYLIRDIVPQENPQYSRDAIEKVMRYVDDAIMLNISNVRIIHGKGTGVLRSEIQRFLRHHKAVKSFRLGTFGEGESGVTIVELK